MTLNWPKWLKRLVGFATSICFLLGNVLAPAALAATEAERASEIATRMSAAMTAIEDGQRDAARDRWDPAYIVETIGIEPSTLYTWVRRNVTWVPYRGALRGPVGVLMDRKGNSLDQALLLAELLEASGRRVRLAHAQLPANVASAELQRQIAGRSSGKPAGPLAPQVAKTAAEQFVDGSGVLDTADAYGIDGKALAEKLKGQVASANTMANKITQRMREQSRALWPALSAQSAELARKDVMDKALAAIGDHWWVQMSTDGQWIDFDLLSSNGAALAPPAQTADAAALAGGLEHKITVRLVIGQWKQGKTSEALALEQSFRPRDLIGKSVKLMHVPSLWPADWPEVTEDDIQIKLRAALYTQKEWLPVLTVDGKQFMRASIMDTGVVNQTPNSGNQFQRMMVPAVGQIAKARDILATIGDPDEKPKADPKLRDPKTPRTEGELVAEWLEFEFAAPGEAPRKMRREIFDLIGPAVRASTGLTYFTMSDDKTVARSMAALGEIEMLIMPNALAPEFLLHMTASNALQNKEFIDELASDPFGKAPANAVETASKITPLPAALLGFAAMRFGANPYADQLFVDRPQVVVQHATMARGKGGDFYTSRALDIVDNRIGIDPAAARNAQQYRLLQGIVDTNTEAEALRMLNETVTANTGDAFSASLKAGKGWTMLKPGDEAKLAALKASPDMTARMLADLKAGQIVVVSAGGDGWWRIDPATGTTLGMGANGSGAAMVEYALVIVIQTIISVAQCLVAKAGTAAIERTLNELGNEKMGRGTPKVDAVAGAVGAGIKEGVKQGKESFEESKKTHHRRCFAMGMMGGIDAGLMMATFDLAKYFAKRELPVGYGGGEGSGGGGAKQAHEGGKPEVEGKGPEQGPKDEKLPPEDRPEQRPKDEQKPKEEKGPESDKKPESKKNPETTEQGESDKKKPKESEQSQSKADHDQKKRDERLEELRDKVKDIESKRAKANEENKKLDDMRKKDDKFFASEEGQKQIESQEKQTRKAREDLSAAMDSYRDTLGKAESQAEFEQMLQEKQKIEDGGGIPRVERRSTGDQQVKLGDRNVDPLGKTGTEPLSKTLDGNQPKSSAKSEQPLDQTVLERPKDVQSRALQEEIKDPRMRDKPTTKEIEQDIDRLREVKKDMKKKMEEMKDLEAKADSDPSPQNERDLVKAKQEAIDLALEEDSLSRDIHTRMVDSDMSADEYARWLDYKTGIGPKPSGGASSVGSAASTGNGPSSAPPKESLIGVGELSNAFGSMPKP